MLDLTLGLPTDPLHLGDPVPARIALRNVGAGDVLVNGRLAPNFPFAPTDLRDLVFSITAPSGHPVELGAFVNVRPLTDQDFVSLAPGAEVLAVIQLEQLFTLTEPGAYTVQVSYQNQSDPRSGPAAWKGELTSNTATFTLR